MTLYVAAIVLIVALLLLLTARHVIVFEFERGLRYNGGRFGALLEPGSYWIFPWRTRITKVDVRPAHITVPGQEIITADGVGLKITVAARYQITDAVKAVHGIASFHEAMYTQLQLGLRELVRAALQRIFSQNAASLALVCWKSQHRKRRNTASS